MKKPMNKFILVKTRLKVGDTVMIRAGKHKGKTGKISKVHRDKNAVSIEGLNVYKKHVKPDKLNPKGGIIELTRPINSSNVGILEPSGKKPSRISMQLGKDGSKKRLYKSSGKEIK